MPGMSSFPLGFQVIRSEGDEDECEWEKNKKINTTTQQDLVDRTQVPYDDARYTHNYKLQARNS